MTISEVILQKTSTKYQEIIDSDFIQEIRSGKLETNKFIYYMNQDVAVKIDSEYKSDFVAYTKSSIAYITSVEEYFFKHPEYQSNSTTLANELYIHHLEKNCAIEKPVEFALSVILACELVYKGLGAYLASNAVADNPYKQWYLPLSDPEYARGVDKLQYIVDQYGSKASNTTQNEMVSLGAEGYVWEYEFFFDSYIG